MCELCKHFPCDFRCPNASEPLIAYYCDECGEPIYDGEIYYKIGEDFYCEECINGFKRVAEIDEIWDEN